MPERVSIVVLAKDTHTAKSRLTLERSKRRRIALRLAATTVRKALAASVGDVYVVPSDRHIADLSPDDAEVRAHAIDVRYG